MVNFHSLIERAKDSRLIILAVSVLVTFIGAVIILASLGTSLPADRAITGLDRVIFTAAFRWSTITCFFVTVANLCASLFHLETVFIITSGAAWWSLPSVTTLLFSGFIIGPLLVIIGTLASFFTWVANYRLSMNQNNVSQAEPGTQGATTKHEEVAGVDHVSKLNEHPVKKILFAAAFISYGIGFVMLGVQIMEVFGSGMPLTKIEYDIADRLLFMLLQSAYTMLLVLFWHFSLNVNLQLLLCLLGYFVSSSFGYALRFHTMSKIAGIFLFLSAVISLVSILMERIDVHLHFGSIREKLKPNIISLVALGLSVIGFVVFSIALGSISSVWTSFAIVLLVAVNLLCVLSSQHEFFWIAWGMSLNAIPFVVFIPVLRGEVAGIIGGAILLIAAILSFISIKTFDLTNPSRLFLNYGLFLLIFPFVFGGIFAGTSPLFIMQAIVLGITFPLFNHFQISASARVTPFALGVLFACSLEYWAPVTKNGSEIFAPIIAVAILIISVAFPMGPSQEGVRLVGMIVVTIIFAKQIQNQSAGAHPPSSSNLSPEADPELEAPTPQSPASPVIVQPHPEPMAVLEFADLEERSMAQQRAIGPYVSDHVDDRFNYSI